MSTTKLLRITEAARRIGVSRALVYQFISSPKFADDKFPRPVAITPNVSGIVESELEDWIASRPRRPLPPAA